MSHGPARGPRSSTSTHFLKSLGAVGDLRRRRGVIRLAWLGIAAAGLIGCGSEAPERSPAATPAFVDVARTGTARAATVRPAATEPAANAAATATRPTTPGTYLVARLREPAALRARPGGRVITRIGPRTEFGSARVLSVTRRRGAWLRVLAPELANGRLGWLRADTTVLGRTRWSLHVDRSARRVLVRRAGRAVWSLPVAVGRSANPTPLGRFAVTDKLRPARPASPYGCCILALTGHQTKLVPGWPGGDRLAIHATPQTGSVGRAASLGCLRAHTGAMRRLLRTIPLGSPVFIRA